MIWLPYAFLFLSVVCALRGFKTAALISLALACVAGLAAQILDVLGLLATLLAVTASCCVVRLPATYRRVVLPALVILGLAMFSHWLPGFHNLLVLDKVHFSPRSAAFSLYLNFDKTAFALALVIFCLPAKQCARLTWPDGVQVLKAWTLLIALSMPAALLIGFVKFDFKIPEQTALWAINNLFFVCFAEETLFRGFIQGGLSRALPTRAWVGWLVGAVGFGLAHFQGGWLYVLLATLAGGFYGWVFKKSNKLQASMFLHFLYNLVHFICFTYPWLQKV